MSEVDADDFKARCHSLDVGRCFYCLGVCVRRYGNTKWEAAGVKGDWRRVFEAVYPAAAPTGE